MCTQYLMSLCVGFKKCKTLQHTLVISIKTSAAQCRKWINKHCKQTYIILHLMLHMLSPVLIQRPDKQSCGIIPCDSVWVDFSFSVQNKVIINLMICA